MAADLSTGIWLWPILRAAKVGAVKGGIAFSHLSFKCLRIVDE